MSRQNLTEPGGSDAIRVIRLVRAADIGIVGATNHPTEPQLTVSGILTGDV
jgi:hypothetical protein